MFCCSETVSVIGTNGLVYNLLLQGLQSVLETTIDTIQFPITIGLTIVNGKVLSMLCIEFTDM